MSQQARSAAGYRVMPAIRAWLYRCRARRGSLLRMLAREVPFQVLEKTVADNTDWRELPSDVAQQLEVTEHDLVQRLARSACLPFARQIPAIVWDTNGAPASVEHWRSVGAIPISDGDVTSGIACVDPARALNLYSEVGGNLYLACWNDIQAALDCVQERGMGPTLLPGLPRPEGSVPVHIALEQLIAEARKHGSVALSLQIEGELLQYFFTTGEGKKASGVVANHIRIDVIEWLRASAQSSQFQVAANSTLHVRIATDDEGRTFRVCWSLAQDLNHRDNDPLAVDRLGSRPGSARKERTESEPIVRVPSPLLVVEDNPSFMRVLETFLKRHTYCATFARNGATALELLRAGLQPALIICDVHMPGIDGLHLLQILRAEECWRRIPVVMLTSDEEIETELRFLELGVAAFQHKHDDPRLLIAHIQRILRGGVPGVLLHEPANAA